ncbi:hypothetical protein KKC62_00665 [Patescibacteria group bacterium]|nr:hypothetical protein [Patescibacteria group bacterium]MBU1952719.1 hypothetical protein [Patescibacteria group bacterium]
MEFYTDLITQKSWEELKELKKLLNFVLIGGWATYLHTKTLKSKDIDIIVDFDKLPDLGKHYQLFKNNRLNKYEAVKNDVQIDIYLPHYSKLGIPVEELIKNTESLGGFTVLKGNYLAALKIFTLQQRGRSNKGRKDLIDILALINSGVVELSKIKEISKIYNLQTSLDSLKVFLDETFEVKELNLNKHGFSRLKREIIKVLGG